MPSCVVYARVSLQQAHEIERVAQGLGSELALARETIEAPGGWWVRLPPSESLQVAERRARELRGLGVRDLFIIREAGPNQFAISLGLFRTESGARQHLADLQSRRVRGAEIAVRNPAVARVEVHGPAPLVRALAERIAGELPDTAPSDCQP
ncbi:MAG TPA: SPOR domain-containing protein [Rhodocyclaceae bacterium]|nr:SPOR domain-containing protein [Rhodocyclaceae bacterium]